ncbi:drebrin-like protein B isoform X1 [Neodiprion pinetum]|uniref:Drebrin-like protein n=1 Tax=Neodiprion lecontei TaxID=441921 RepID=A0A6J0CD71_NEOLC|nr:drebrin-like protein isoform X1 [Neodiprion lecontei]XP_046471923.1 drebrin-like protein isoform X1 [Neodiprion pinetum]XP_046471924.1 drebrin-like protein isoform X1 [Neodiprion pinetum]XP_046589813.1 drebrin-like protein isoform X1 [Neodiprion lecontei]
MSVNLTKNKESLSAAWRSVVDDKSTIDWALFSYEGQSNDLKLVSTGDGGLQEMIEELNSGKIMYAFCRVIDEKTSLPKCVLINWQGEGAPIVRKGTCANHIRDIEKLLKGAHVTINARTEEEVEVDLIMDKLARATGSSYKFNEPRGENGGQLGPVGTTYRRVIPEQEINASERDQFWQREELEEKQRLEEERSRRDQERVKLELERRSREEKESELRDAQVTAKESIVTKHRQAELRAQEITNFRNQQNTETQRNTDSDEERKSRSEELRRQRSKETQQLIAQRTINARAVFEQNTAAGQMKSVSFVPKTSELETRVESNNIVNRILETVAKVNIDPQIPIQNTGKVIETEPEILQSHVDAPLAAQITASPQSQPKDSKSHNLQPDIEETAELNVQETETELYNQLEEGSYVYFDPNNEGMKARALYDYQAADNTEITFDPGDVITHIDAIDEGWWQGLGPDGTYGLFPANYVEVIE